MSYAIHDAVNHLYGGAKRDRSAQRILWLGLESVVAGDCLLGRSLLFKRRNRACQLCRIVHSRRRLDHAGTWRIEVLAWRLRLPLMRRQRDRYGYGPSMPETARQIAASSSETL